MPGGARPARRPATPPRHRYPAISQIYGNTLGIKPSQKKALERTYRRRVDPDQVVSPELAPPGRRLARPRPPGRRADRPRGRDRNVIVGDATKIEMPDVGRLRGGTGRFRGLRLVHTHLRGEPLTSDDLNDLACCASTWWRWSRPARTGAPAVSRSPPGAHRGDHHQRGPRGRGGRPLRARRGALGPPSRLRLRGDHARARGGVRAAPRGRRAAPAGARAGGRGQPRRRALRRDPRAGALGGGRDRRHGAPEALSSIPRRWSGAASCRRSCSRGCARRGRGGDLRRRPQAGAGARLRGRHRA
jgi:hypothetical protein